MSQGAKMEKAGWQKKQENGGTLRMEELLFATNNLGKVNEIKQILDEKVPGKYKVLSLKDVNIDVDIEENGKTFEENSIIKAKAISELTGKMVLADDSGFEVDYLGGEPGIYSARYLGEDTSYEIKNRTILDRCKDAKEDERGARFVGVISCVYPDGNVITSKGVIEGVLADEPKGTNGFGYDPIFYVPEFGMTTGEMDPLKKNEISHRGKALRGMVDKLMAKERRK